MDRNSESRFNLSVGFVLILLLVVLIVYGIRYSWDFLALAVYVILTVILVVMLTKSEASRHNKLVDLSKVIGRDANEAFNYAKIGLLTYDESFNITWMSDFFLQRDINFIGQKITKWIPEVNRIFQEDEESIVVEYAEKNQFFQVIRKQDSQMLFFLDVTDRHNLETRYDNEKVVLGLIHLDNYDEATQYEEETRISIIDSEIKQPVIEWAISHNMLIKRIKSDRYLIALNEEILSKLYAENFSILDKIRKASDEYPIPITLSMAIARGTSNYRQLDEMLNDLLELAQSRGGDQIAIKVYGQDVKYIGGNSEAKEKRSKVRVRVIAQSLRELIKQAKDVIIVGHKETDFDCMASAIGVSRIVQVYHKPVSIVVDPDNVEKQLSLCLKKYNDKLTEWHNFVTEDQALAMLDDNTLVIMVDHHNLVQCNASRLIQAAKKIVVIDHHRRTGDFEFNPIMVYLEASASSAAELVTELLPYQTTTVDISEVEATIMYTGVYLDTMGFVARTSSRTFEAVADLKKLGADTLEAKNFLKEDYNEFELKSNILNNCEKYDNGIVIATYNGNKKLSRSLISQVANQILNIQEVEASFVIGNLDDDTVAMSARSNGNINVQLILEQMHGGGHFSQAGLQRSATTVDEIKKELLQNIDGYFKSREA